MMTTGAPGFMLYGAYGYTGELIARLAVERGLRPLLAGRDAARLGALGQALNLPFLPLALDDPAGLDRALQQTRLVLHCAGPFAQTSPPMVAACLRNGVHYLDITGEISVFEDLAGQDAQARQAGVMLLPGIGFDVVPSDCLAAHLKQRLPDASHLRLGILGLSQASRGTTRTALQRLDQPAVARIDGQITPIESGRRRSFDFGRGPKEALAIGWGDVSTAYYSTGIPNIETYMVLPGNMKTLMKFSRRLGPLLNSRPVQALLHKAVATLLPPGPSAEQRRRGFAILVGEASNPAGEQVTARLLTPEAYALTAETALLAAQKLLHATPPGGFHTPSMAFGADFILKIPGCALA
jgi:short subunit dehydrogenase-like uncharacterized protein